MASAWHVARTMRALELLAYTPLTAPRVAEALGAHPRTVRRVLDQLVAEEYLTCGEGPPRRYGPTMRLVALAGQVLANAPLVQHARPYVLLVQERTDAAAELVMPSYQSVLCVLRAGSDGQVAGPAVQHAVPAHCCAGGKVLLAWRERWRDSVLATPLQRDGDPATDPLMLRRELEAVRADGYATARAQTAPGATAVAAPVIADGEAVAALQVDGLKPGVDRGYLARLVVRTARELSDDLAARPL